MATLEKPKVKTKKSKVKPKPEVSINTLAEVDDQSKEINESAVSGELPVEDIQDVDFDQFATTSTRNIISQECFIASEYVEPTDDVPTTGNISPGQVSLAEELAQIDSIKEASTASPSVMDLHTTPTAPIDDASKTIPTLIAPIETVPVLQYPNLTTLQHVETKSNVIYKPTKAASPKYSFTNSQLLPFTLEQRKQLYHCADLDLVQQFELDFLMNSLLETYENDPLYAALIEYYNLQSKLSVNKYDVDKARKLVTNAQKHIWTEVPVTKTFSALCGDKVLVKETVTYK
uniref:Ectopic P granules protein 5 homolog n=1 Tax=Zeugodacus cucurbitae TaxID=28588 RepID=A0A0A1XQX2_ZEUCU